LSLRIYHEYSAAITAPIAAPRKLANVVPIAIPPETRIRNLSNFSQVRLLPLNCLLSRLEKFAAEVGSISKEAMISLRSSFERAFRRSLISFFSWVNMVSLLFGGDYGITTQACTSKF
jgi:hypothetical protein